MLILVRSATSRRLISRASRWRRSHTPNEEESCSALRSQGGGRNTVRRVLTPPPLPWLSGAGAAVSTGRGGNRLGTSLGTSLELYAPPRWRSNPRRFMLYGSGQDFVPRRGHPGLAAARPATRRPSPQPGP